MSETFLMSLLEKVLPNGAFFEMSNLDEIIIIIIMMIIILVMKKLFV